MSSAELVAQAARKGQLAEAKDRLRQASNTASWYADKFTDITLDCFRSVRANLDAAEALWLASQANPQGEQNGR